MKARSAVTHCVAVAAIVSACTEPSIAPDARLELGAAAPMSAVVFHPMNVRYAVSGTEPATGRSGSASIQLRSLLAKDGTALVEVTTGSFLEDTAPGAFGNVQVKLSLLGGVSSTSAYAATTDSGYWSRDFESLTRGDTVSVQAGVRGIDPARTGIVSATTVTLLRPDLSAVSLSGPATAPRNVPVSFVALVSELNGDVGAQADCVLSEGGTVLDQVVAMWVDAGDAVSCSFTKAFSTVGVHHLTVTVSNVRPGDWDYANNSASATIEILPDETPIEVWSAYASRTQRQSVIRQWNTGDVPFDQTDETREDRSEFGVVGYAAGVYLSYPLARVTVDVTSDGSEARSFTFNAGTHSTSPGGECWRQYGTGIIASACSDILTQLTTMWVARVDGTVTYISSGYDCMYYVGTGCSTWTSNRVTTYGSGTALELGTSVAIKVAFVGANGRVHAINAAIAMQDQSAPYNSSTSYCRNDLNRGGQTCFSQVNTGRYLFGAAAAP